MCSISNVLSIFHVHKQFPKYLNTTKYIFFRIFQDIFLGLFSLFIRNMLKHKESAALLSLFFAIIYLKQFSYQCINSQWQRNPNYFI